MIRNIRTLKVVNTTLVVLTVLGIAGAFLLLPAFITINNRYDITQAQVDSLKQQGVIASAIDIQELDRRTADLEAKLAVSTEASPTELIKIIRALAGKDILLTGFSKEKSDALKLSVTGVATTREALQAYIESLKGQQKVESVDSPIANYVKSKDADFTITVSFKK